MDIHLLQLVRRSDRKIGKEEASKAKIDYAIRTYEVEAMVKKRQTAAPGPPPRGWLRADELGIMLAFNQLADMLAKELDAEKDEALALRKALLGLIFLTEHLVHLTEVSLSVKPLLHYLVSDFTPLLNHFDDNSEHPLVAGENIRRQRGDDGHPEFAIRKDFFERLDTAAAEAFAPTPTPQAQSCPAQPGSPAPRRQRSPRRPRKPPALNLHSHLSAYSSSLPRRVALRGTLKPPPDC